MPYGKRYCLRKCYERGIDKIITDEKKQQIINDYAELKSSREVAKKNGVSHQTVMNTVKSGIQKKSKSVSDYMAENSDEFYRLLDLYIEILGSSEKLESSPINQIASAFGTIVEKFTAIYGEGSSKTSKFENILNELKRGSRK